MIQAVLTPAAGKRLIARGIAAHPAVQARMETGTLAILAGTTNGYAAQEILSRLGQEKDFSPKAFFRGITRAPGSGKMQKEEFPGDVIIVDGKWQRGKTIFDVADQLGRGDVVLKGANCVNLFQEKAGVLIGHPEGGTIGAVIHGVIGKRVKLIVPVGLEKRITEDIDAVADLLNDPYSSGPRMMPMPGEVITELEALKILTHTEAILTAAGGVDGAEGAVWISVIGEEEEVEKAKTILDEVAGEPPFSI
ncbi:MAG: hypothetical protein ACLFST_07615 [Spirochaetia bacterium]